MTEGEVWSDVVVEYDPQLTCRIDWQDKWTSEMTDVRADICHVLFEQAKLCKNGHAAGLIMSCMRWILDGETCYEGDESLAELADRLVIGTEEVTNE